MDIQTKLSRARSKVIIHHRYYASLLSRLPMREAEGIGTMGTDGNEIIYDPKFVEKLSIPEVIGVIVHEEEHCSLGHPWRIGDRDPAMSNEAMDFVVNWRIKQPMNNLPNGHELPGRPLTDDEYLSAMSQGKQLEGFYLFDPKYQGLSFERIYALRYEDRKKAEQEGQGEPNGQGQKQNSTFGEVYKAPEKGKNTETSWKTAVIKAAAIARKAGKLPGHIEELVEMYSRSQVDWKAAGEQFAKQLCREDYSYTRPNKHFVSHGTYIPTLRGEEIETMAFGFDTSGSVSNKELAAGLAEFNAMVDILRPKNVLYIECDAQIHECKLLERGEAMAMTERKFKGRGGTDLRQIFNKIKELDLEPAGLVVVTDLETPFPAEEPPWPTLWVSVNERHTAPFGQTVYMTDGGME